jgi:hypothetical protein
MGARNVKQYSTVKHGRPDCNGEDPLGVGIGRHG